eukprot:3615566-Rhodomonas_salina.1
MGGAPSVGIGHRGAQYAVRVEGASFGWEQSNGGGGGDGQSLWVGGGGREGEGRGEPLVVLREVSAGLRVGSNTAVVGGGQGKSALLLGLMGERVAVEGRVLLQGEEGPMGYCAADPWVLSAPAYLPWSFVCLVSYARVWSSCVVSRAHFWRSRGMLAALISRCYAISHAPIQSIIPVRCLSA